MLASELSSFNISQTTSPYGVGKAAMKIVQFIEKNYT